MLWMVVHWHLQRAPPWFSTADSAPEREEMTMKEEKKRKKMNKNVQLDEAGETVPQHTETSREVLLIIK